MTGVVTSELELVMPVRLRGPTGITAEIRAVIDTGFNDFLTLPLKAINALALLAGDATSCLMADGTRSSFESYKIEIEWFGEWKLIPVIAIDTNPLLGTSLLLGSRLSINMVDGGRVDIDPLPHL